MNRTYHYELVRPNGTIYHSNEYNTIDECVEECKGMCEVYDVEYCDSEVCLFLNMKFLVKHIKNALKKVNL